MSVLKTCRPPKRCFPWKCGSQRAPEFTQLTTPRNRTPIRHPVRSSMLSRLVVARHKHKITHTIACWLTLPRRHKHLHCDLWEESAPEGRKRTGQFETFPLKWGYSVKCLKWLKRCSSWDFSAASIASVKWKHTGWEIKRRLRSTEDCLCCSASWNFRGTAEEEKLKGFYFIQNNVLSNQQQHIDQEFIYNWMNQKSLSYLLSLYLLSFFYFSSWTEIQVLLVFFKDTTAQVSRKSAFIRDFLHPGEIISPQQQIFIIYF